MNDVPKIRAKVHAMQLEGMSEGRIAEALGLNASTLRVKLGREIRLDAEALKAEGKSNAEIATSLGIAESSVRRLTGEEEILEESNIWTLGEYQPRGGDFDKYAGDISREELVTLVQERARFDGEWALRTGKVEGGNVAIFRRMMEWVSEPKNIEQCYNSNLDIGPTVDWICRNLAQASQRIAGGLNRD